MADRKLFRVTFHNQGQVYEIFARSVGQGSIFGFVEVEDPVFDQKSKMVVDPNEERLQKEFEGVKRFHVPLHAVVRIDEVVKGGTSRIVKGEGASVEAFPLSIYRPQGDPPKS